jgi:hypothetical protein
MANTDGPANGTKTAVLVKTCLLEEMTGRPCNSQGIYAATLHFL